MTKSKNALPAYLDFYGEALSAYTKAVLGANEAMLGYGTAIFRTFLTPVAPLRRLPELPAPATPAPAVVEPVASAGEIVEFEPARSATEELVRDAEPGAVAEALLAANDASAGPVAVSVLHEATPQAPTPERRTTKPSKTKPSGTKPIKTRTSETKPSKTKTSKPPGRRKK